MRLFQLTVQTLWLGLRLVSIFMFQRSTVSYIEENYLKFLHHLEGISGFFNLITSNHFLGAIEERSKMLAIERNERFFIKDQLGKYREFVH